MPNKKPIPLAVMIPLDCLLLAGSLLSFSYFHHVNPLIKEKTETRTAARRDVDIYGVSTDAKTDTTAPTTQTSLTSAAALTTDSASQTTLTASGTASDLSGTGSTASGTTVSAADSETAENTQTETAAPAETEKTEAAQTNAPEKTEAPAKTETTVKTTTTTTTTTTATTAPQYDLSGWGAKFPEVFSLGDEVESDENHYRSHDLYVELREDSFAGSNVHICDIYIRKFDSFKAAFEHDEFKNGPQENMCDLAERKDAVVAINGDFTGGRENGVIIREYDLFRDVKRGDIGAVFYDGTFQSYAKDEVDTDWLLDNSVRHTMTFGPALVKDGEAADSSSWGSQLAQQHPRSAFGYYEPGHYCFVAVDGRGMGGSQGVTAAELAEYMDDTLGCEGAYNLDGGASSQLWFNGRIVNQPDKFNGDKSSLRGLTDIFYFGEADE